MKKNAPDTFLYQGHFSHHLICGSTFIAEHCVAMSFCCHCFLCIPPDFIVKRFELHSSPLSIYHNNHEKSRKIRCYFRRNFAAFSSGFQ